MKKLLSTTLAITLIASLATGCGNKPAEQPAASEGGDKPAASESGDAPAADTKITWLSQGPGETGWEGLTKDILAKYKQDTGVEVVGEFYSFNDLFDVIEVKIASGSSDYDVISVDVPMVAGYANRGYILPLDDYFTEDELAQYAEASLNAARWDGKFYAPPMNTSSQVLWYNTKLLEDAGVKIRENGPDNRLTYDEIVGYAKQVKEQLDPDGSQQIIGFDFQQVSRVYQMNALANSLGGKNIGDDGYTVQGVLNDQAWVDAMTWYQKQVQDGICSRGISADEMGNYFETDKLVFMIGGTWTAGSAERKGMTHYGYAYLPTFEGHEDQVGSGTGSWNFGVNAASKNVDASAEFSKWMSIGEGNDLWLVANGDIPSRISKLDEMISGDQAEYLKIGAYEAQNTAVARALTPGFNEYSTILDAAWEDVRNGADVKETLDSAVAQIDTAMAALK